AALGALRAFVARKRSYFVLVAAAVAGPLAVIAPALWVLNEGAVIGPTDTELIVVAGIAVFGLVIWLLADLTHWWLHAYQRGRVSGYGRENDSSDVIPARPHECATRRLGSKPAVG